MDEDAEDLGHGEGVGVGGEFEAEVGVVEGEVGGIFGAGTSAAGDIRWIKWFYCIYALSDDT